MDLKKIDLKTPNAELFSDTAEATALYFLKNCGTKKNKRSQLRGFYDEILVWDQRARSMDDAQFKSLALPLIQMIRAKVAYAKGRENVDDAYLSTINHCLAQVSNKDTLRNFKLFMEAVTGFLRLHDSRK